MAAPEGYNALGKIGLSYKGEYDSNTVYERLDAVYHSGSTYLALKDAPAGAPSSDGTNWRYLAKGFPSDIGESEIAFEEAAVRENIDTGESIKTVFGKIKKWFADMTAAAFAQVISSNTDLMALTTSGYLPDALAVKNQFAEMDNALTVKNITSDFTNTNLISFMALKYGNEIRIFFVGDTTKDFSLVTTKWKPKFPTEYLCLNYSAWNNAAGYQGVVSRIAKTDGTIAEYKTSEGLLYAYMTPLCFIYYI